MSIGLAVLMLERGLISGCSSSTDAEIWPKRKPEIVEGRLFPEPHGHRECAASSISHELNQPLAAILSNAAAAQILIEAEPPDLNQIREILADICRDDQARRRSSLKSVEEGR